MRYFDTFTGIGGFTKAIEQAYEALHNRPSRENEQETDTQPDSSHAESEYARKSSPRCVGFSEIDKYASAIYQRHYPEHHNYGDITKIDETKLPDFDLFVGGFPCQAFSIAGKRRGFDDTRGTLFFDIARILRAKRPRLLLLENVKGLLSHDDGRTFKTIVATLDELGYDLQWQVLNSKNHGVPQNRERVLIVGHLRGTPRPEVFPFQGDSGQASELSGQHANTLTARYYGAQANGTYVAEGELDAQEGIVRIPEATKKGYAEATVGQSINLSVPNSKTRRGRVSDVAQTLDTGMQQHTLTGDMRIRRLTPTECERLQGFPEVELSSIIEVCTENLKNHASAESQNLRSQSSVENAEKIGSREGVKYAVVNLSPKYRRNSLPAQHTVLINCGEKGVEIHSQGKCILNASHAERGNWSHPHLSLEDFVHLCVGLNTIAERTTRGGLEESRLNGQSSTLLLNGETQESWFGKGTMPLAEDAMTGSTILKELSRFITSDLSQTEEAEQFLRILSSYVTHVITGFIPEEILSQNSWNIQIDSKVGWTWGVSDTQRYKCLGNAVTVNTVQAIMERIMSS